MTYSIPRPSGHVILGGTYGINDWDLSPSPTTAQQILEACHGFCPSLSPDGTGLEGIRILRHNVGLRPGRKQAPRLERETIRLPLKGSLVPLTLGMDLDNRRSGSVNVIHAYGIGGAGYQCSWGMALEVVDLIDECFGTKS